MAAETMCQVSDLVHAGCLLDGWRASTQIRGGR
jgi:hypothetical protein